MRAAIRAIVIVLVATVAVLAAVGSIRWAKRNTTGAQVMASAMLLVLGIGVPIVNPPQQGVEEAREDKGKKGRRVWRPTHRLSPSGRLGGPTEGYREVNDR